MGDSATNTSLTLGTIFSGTESVVVFVAYCFVLIFGITGLILVYSALHDLVDMTKSNRRVRPAAPAVKAIGAAFLFEIPETVGCVWSQIFSTSTPEQVIGQQASGTSTATNCLAQTGTSANPVGCIINNIATDCVPQACTLVMCIAAASSLFFYYRFVMTCVNKLSYGDHSIRLPWGNIVVGTAFAGLAGFVFVLGQTIGFASSDISVDGFAASSAWLAYVPTASSLPTSAQQMITGALSIFAVVGVCEVMHGGYILAAAMNGHSNAGGWKAAGHSLFGLGLVFVPQLAAAVFASAFGQTV